jgi:hypothetical protein
MNVPGTDDMRYSPIGGQSRQESRRAGYGQIAKIGVFLRVSREFSTWPRDKSHES